MSKDKINNLFNDTFEMFSQLENSDKYTDILDRLKENIISEVEKNNTKSKQNEKYPRPRGRSPKGKTWNYDTGEWIINENKQEDNYESKKLSELKKIASKLGISEDTFDLIDDSKNPKKEIIKYINKYSHNSNNEITDISQSIPETTNFSDEKIEYLNEINSNELINDSTIIYEGVEYYLNKETNELSDPDNYETIGIWKNGFIEFNEGMKEEHELNENHINNI